MHTLRLSALTMGGIFALISLIFLPPMTSAHTRASPQPAIHSSHNQQSAPLSLPHGGDVACKETDEALSTGSAAIAFFSCFRQSFSLTGPLNSVQFTSVAAIAFPPPSSPSSWQNCTVTQYVQDQGPTNNTPIFLLAGTTPHNCLQDLQNGNQEATYVNGEQYGGLLWVSSTFTPQSGHLYRAFAHLELTTGNTHVSFDWISEGLVTVSKTYSYPQPS